MAYNKKLLYVSEAPSWITEAGSLGTFIHAGNPISNINLSAAEFFNDVITYSVTSGSLPTGLSLNSSTGVISGTLTGYSATVTVDFSITATDSEGESNERDFSLNVLVEYQIDYLVVAGGGGGGGQTGGGGGAGGYLESNFVTPRNTSYSIIVGAGGARCPAGVGEPSIVGTNGGNSSLIGSSLNITSIGGGRGGSYQGSRIDSLSSGSNGGSGGGGAALSSGLAGTGGVGTSGQGNNGAAGRTNYTAQPFFGGGGGGAGAVGTTNLGTKGGDGGNGLQSSITGTPTYYAGGGGGCGTGYPGYTTPGNGGLGGGATGGNDATPALNATANTGGGGGGGRDYGTVAGGASDGGSGVVILRMPTVNYSGTTTGSPTVTTYGTDTILKYTGSGTYTS